MYFLWPGLWICMATCLQHTLCNFFTINTTTHGWDDFFQKHQTTRSKRIRTNRKSTTTTFDTRATTWNQNNEKYSMNTIHQPSPRRSNILQKPCAYDIPCHRSFDIDLWFRRLSIPRAIRALKFGLRYYDCNYRPSWFPRFLRYHKSSEIHVVNARGSCKRSSDIKDKLHQCFEFIVVILRHYILVLSIIPYRYEDIVTFPARYANVSIILVDITKGYEKQLRIMLSKTNLRADDIEASFRLL